MAKQYGLAILLTPEIDVPWVVTAAEHAAATPCICSFFETKEEALCEIERLEKLNKDEKKKERLIAGYGGTPVRSRSTFDLDGLYDRAKDWADRAEAFIIQNGWSLTDENRQKLIQTTSLYLMHMDAQNVSLARKDCYVVHSQDKEWRYQTKDRRNAFIRFKVHDKVERVAMFHWDDKGNCTRLFASDGYSLSRDY